MELSNSAIVFIIFYCYNKISEVVYFIRKRNLRARGIAEAKRACLTSYMCRALGSIPSMEGKERGREGEKEGEREGEREEEREEQLTVLEAEIQDQASTQV
jgi:hypothetical protein